MVHRSSGELARGGIMHRCAIRAFRGWLCATGAKAGTLGEMRSGDAGSKFHCCPCLRPVKGLLGLSFHCTPWRAGSNSRPAGWAGAPVGWLLLPEVRPWTRLGAVAAAIGTGGRGPRLASGHLQSPCPAVAGIHPHPLAQCRPLTLRTLNTPRTQFWGSATGSC
jgi:hypothetical protein